MKARILWKADALEAGRINDLFYPITRLRWNQRWRHHVASMAKAHELAMNTISYDQAALSRMSRQRDYSGVRPNQGHKIMARVSPSHRLVRLSGLHFKASPNLARGLLGLCRNSCGRQRKLDRVRNLSPGSCSNSPIGRLPRSGRSPPELDLHK